jgi:hypothetical protein
MLVRNKLSSATNGEQYGNRQISDHRDPQRQRNLPSYIADLRFRAHIQGMYASFPLIFSLEVDGKSIRGNWGIIERKVRRKYGELPQLTFRIEARTAAALLAI